MENAKFRFKKFQNGTIFNLVPNAISNYLINNKSEEENSFSGGEVINKIKKDFPIYKDENDFFERNKNRTTSIPNTKTEKVEIKSEDGFPSYYIDKEVRTGGYKEEPLFTKNKMGHVKTTYCKGEECTARAARVIDGLVPGSSMFLKDNVLKKKINANYSVNREPTEEEKEKYSYMIGDRSSGSLDAWDVIRQYKKSGNKNLVVLDKTNEGDTPISYEELKNSDAFNNIGVGAYINVGSKVDKGEGSGGSHTVRVVGFLEDGEPLVSDYGDIRRLSNLNFSYSNQIIGIANVPEKNQYNFQSFKERLEKANSKREKPYIEDLDNLPVMDGKEVSRVKSSDEFRKFHNTIVNDTNLISSYLNKPKEKIEEYAKLAMAIAGAETEYGTGLVHKLTDRFGDSTGVSQINMDNVEEKYADILEKYPKGSTERNALATVLYMNDLDGYSEHWYNKGLKKQERPYRRKGYDLSKEGIKREAKDAVRFLQGRVKQGYIEGRQLANKDIFRYDGKTVKLPFKQFWQDDESYKKEVEEYFKENNIKDLRFDYDDKGNRVIYKKTKGNQIPNNILDRIAYSWQSPTTLSKGDAQGDSTYYKKIKDLYRYLFNENIEKNKLRKGGKFKFQQGSVFDIAPRQGVRKNPDGDVSTHKMKAEVVDGVWYVFPTVFQNQDGTWENKHDERIMKNERDWMSAYEEAKKRGEVISFGKGEEAAKKAIDFSKGSWKTEYNVKKDQSENPDRFKFKKGGNLKIGKPGELNQGSKNMVFTLDKENAERKHTLDGYDIKENEKPKQDNTKSTPGYLKKIKSTEGLKQVGENLYIKNQYKKGGLIKYKKGGDTKKDACYYKVKARYKVFPSAYASGALVRCRKVGAKNWGNSKKQQGGILKFKN